MNRDRALKRIILDLEEVIDNLREYDEDYEQTKIKEAIEILNSINFYD